MILFFFSFQICVPTLWVYFIFIFHNTRREKLDSNLWPRCYMFSDCSKWRYLLKLYMLLFFLAFSWFGRCHIWRRCRLEKAPSFSQSTHVRSSSLLVQLWPQLTSAFFLNSRWQKQRPYANWQWQVSTWTTAERKNQRYLSLIYFNAKTVYWVQAVFFSHRNTVATSTVPSRVPDQCNHSCCSNPRVVYFSQIVMYVCIWARWWLH